MELFLEKDMYLYLECKFSDAMYEIDVEEKLRREIVSSILGF